MVIARGVEAARKRADRFKAGIGPLGRDDFDDGGAGKPTAGCF
jgi:hypothetical protein